MRKFKVYDFGKARDEAQAKLAKKKRTALFASVRVATKSMGPELGGYALVVWDQNGRCCTSMNSGNGKPIMNGRVASFCHEQLVKHHTVDMVDTSESTHIPED